MQDNLKAQPLKKHVIEIKEENKLFYIQWGKCSEEIVSKIDVNLTFWRWNIQYNINEVMSEVEQFTYFREIAFPKYYYHIDTELVNYSFYRFPFKLNRIWSCFQFSFCFGTKRDFHLVSIETVNYQHNHIPLNLKVNWNVFDLLTKIGLTRKLIL